MDMTKGIDVIIDVRDVYKSFRVYYDKGSMLKEQFVSPGRSRYEEREILKGISFRVYRGETVALIGQNGCGKSTTLKMLTKILYPNKGEVVVNGKVSSLIELGAGFHPDMSGRENIYINASILGIKKDEVDRRIDEIVRFSELEEFIDNPIRTYSSGMYMRLAFSVAINVDADILLIDEILAVGDQAFQEKCIRKLDELRSSGVTVVLVSHSMEQIKSIADRCIWIERGKIVEDGDTGTVCDHYEESMTRRREERDELEEEERRREERDELEEDERRCEERDELEEEDGRNEERDELETERRRGEQVDIDEDIKENVTGNIDEDIKENVTGNIDKNIDRDIDKDIDKDIDRNNSRNINIDKSKVRDIDRNTTKNTYKYKRRKQQIERRKAFSDKWQGRGVQGLPLAGTVAMALFILAITCLDIFPFGSENVFLSGTVMFAGMLFYVPGSIGMPMLLILLGFKLLSENYNSYQGIISFYKNKFAPAILTWGVWVIIYDVFLHFWCGNPISIISIVKEILVINYINMSHGWIVRFVLMFMLITPPLARILQTFSAKTLQLVLIIVWIFTFMFPCFDLYGQANGGEKSFPFYFGTICYLFYFCAGHMISRYSQRMLKGSRELLIFVLAYAGAVFSQVFMALRGVDYWMKPTYYLVSVMAILGFDLLVRVKVDDMFPRLSKVIASAFGLLLVSFFIFRPLQMLIVRAMGNFFLTFANSVTVGDSGITVYGNGAAGGMVFRLCVLLILTYAALLGVIALFGKIRDSLGR